MSVSTAMEPSHAGSDPNGTNGGTSTLLVLQLKPIATFKSNDEYLYAMKEDLADWFTCLYKLTITVDNFFEVLETGVMLCEHANKVRRYATERTQKGIRTEMHSNFIRDLKVPQYEVQYRMDVRPQTFQARDNISQFIAWTKKLGIPDVLCFETDDLVLRKNEKSVVLCLLEIARVGAKLGMLAPTLVQMEEEIDEELATGEPPKQIKTCDIKSLHEMVQELAGRCTCPVQFPIIKVGEGKYKIGDSQTLVFVRILRNHVMIRVGGGWDTLEHYLDKHDPCRCGFAGHRQSTSRAGGTPARRASTTAVSHSVPTTPRSPRKMSVQPSSVSANQRPPSPARMRSMSPSPASSPRKIPSQPIRKVSMPSESIYSNQISDSSTGQKSISNNTRRSQSPVPAKFRSPSPVSYTNKPSQVTTTTTGASRSQVSQVARPASPVKSAVPVPRRCTSPSPARRCVSPGPSRHCVSPGPSRRNTSLSTPRTSRIDDRRQLPQRPSMDSSGNDSEETDVTSGSTPNQNNLSLDQISTMTLDEFKSLLNNALSVPNGNTSEGSLDSPRSQSSTDSFKHTYTGRPNKKPPLSEATQKYRTWANRKDASRSFDTGNSARQDKILKSTQSSDEYYELDRPSRKTSSVTRPKTPVSSVPRPKTPVSSAPRPKTPVSSVPRPKTPVSSVSRPKTPVSVSSASRPKTPTSQFRSTTPVSVSRSTTGIVPRPSPGVTRQASGSSGTGRPSTPTRLQSSSTGSVTRTSYETKPEQRSGSLNRTFGEQNRTELRSSSLTGIANDENSDNSLNISGTRTLPSSKSDLTSDMPSSRSERIAEIRARLAASRYGTDSGSATSTAPPTNSSNSQYRKESFDSTAHVSPKPEQTSPNVSYVSITSEVAAEAESDQGRYFSKTYQAMRQLSSGSIDKKLVTHSGSDVSLSVRSDGSYQSSSVERSYGSSRQSSLSSVESSPKEEFTSVSKDKINRTQSLDDNLIKKSAAADETPIVPVMNSPEERIARPTTPARPSTPSLIPRPCTPLSSLKDSIHNLEKQPAYSGQNNVSQTNSGRPPTPRKATILAKAPSAANTPKTSNAGNTTSYTKMFLAKRSSTPGPTPSSTSVATPRRSRTPGPGDRDRSFSTPSQKSIKDNSFDSYGGDVADPPRARNVPASPAPQRRSRTPSIEHRSLSAQNSVEGETVLTVNRSGGRHVLSTCDSKETKTPRPSGGRIIARAASASQNQKPLTDVDRSRSRARTVTSTPTSSLRVRPRSVDPESAASKRAEENVLVVQRGENGNHFVNNRTEAWVESAAKNTKTKTPTKSLPPKSVYRRCKTPNPRDIHEHELESRPLEEIKAALSLPINGLKEVAIDDLDAPPEDADAYAKMDELFRRLKAKELRASVNETPGGSSDPTRKTNSDHDESDVASGDVCSLDSNENVKRKSSKSSYKSSPSISNRGSTASTPSRPKTPSFPQKDPGTPRQYTRANSMPPRPSTPTRSSLSRKSSSNSVHSAPVPETNIKRSVSDHTSMLVSKIKELINTKPRKDDKSGPRSKIPAPKSLSAIGKSKSVSNLMSSSNLENISPNKGLSNGDLSQTYDFSDDVCGEISKYSSHDQLDYNGYNGTIRNGSETPVPKLSTPLTTGRKEFLNNQRENTRTPKLVRAVSIGSLSSSSNTLSCNVGDEDDYV